MGILDKFIASKSKVGIFVSPRQILEMVEYDVEDEKVLKYSYVDLEYNMSARQIEDFEDFEEKVKFLFNELDIKPTSSVFLSLPSIIIGHQTFPSILDDDSVKMALMSEAEKSYIFKKNEPIISWQEISSNFDAQTRFLAYSAFQKNDIEIIEDIFKRLGSDLVSIDTSYASFIKGLAVSKKIPESCIGGMNWNILLINSNSYVILSLIGDKLVDIFEDPLAIKSFNQDELYPTISSAASDNLSNYPADHLIVVSESNDVSAEVLAGYITVPCEKTFIECNRYIKEDLVEVDLNVLPNKKTMISPEIIGTASWDRNLIPLNFNFSSSNVAVATSASAVKIGGKTIMMTPELFQKCLIGVIGILCVVLIAFYFIVTSLKGANDKVYQALSSELKRFESMINESVNKQKSVKVSDIVVKIYNNNKDVLKSYDAIAIDIPEKLWLEQFQMSDDMSALIKGRSYTIDDVINYYQSLKKLAKFKDLKITSLKVTGSSSEIDSGSAATQKLPSLSGQKYYEFEFGNTSSGTGNNSNNGNSNNNANNSGNNNNNKGSRDSSNDQHDQYEYDMGM